MKSSISVEVSSVPVSADQTRCQLVFETGYVLGLKRSPCYLEVMTYSVAHQSFWKSRTGVCTFFICRNRSLGLGETWGSLLLRARSCRRLQWGSRSLGDAQEPNSPNLPPSAGLARELGVGWCGFFPVLFLFTRSVRIMEKQGRRVKTNVYATAEATWAVPGVMPIEVFPYQWINNFSVNSFTSL